MEDSHEVAYLKGVNNFMYFKYLSVIRKISVRWVITGVIAGILFIGIIRHSTAGPKKKKPNSANYKGSWAQVKDILAQVNPPEFPDKDFMIKEYGAEAGGKKDCKEAFEKAIDACSSTGGGRVVVPKGKFLVNGPIHLKNNVNLHLMEGSRVLFSTDPSFYLPTVLVRWEGTRIYNYSPFIYALEKTNIALTGPGTLDGQAKGTWSEWNKKAKKGKRNTDKMAGEGVPVIERQFGEGDYLRPAMVQFYECRNILIQEINLEDSPFWCVQPAFSENVTVRNMKFFSHNPNNDGIDVDSCVYVYIHDIIFNNDDDNIAIKSGRDTEGRDLARPSRNIVIQDCEFNNYTGIAIGSEMSGGVFNVFAENCVAKSRVKRGLYLKSSRDRGGEIAHIRMRNMEFLDARREMLCLGTDYESAEEYNHIPHFHDIRFEKIKAIGSCKYGLRVVGQPEQHIHDFVLKDITIDKAGDISKIKYTDGPIMQNVRINGKLQRPNADNLPPDVYAGPDQKVKVGKAVKLSAEAADDNTLPEKLSYKWSVISGNKDSVKISNPDKRKTEALFSSPGTYILLCMVNDGDLSGEHTLIVTVQ